MKIKVFQEGGQTPAAPAAPAAGGEDQIMAQLEQMAAEIVQQLGPEAAAALAQIIMEKIQSQAPVGAAPEEQQFMRKGGKICKKACGGTAKKTHGGKAKKR